MSSWNSLQLKFDPFGPLKPPLQSILTVLETIEAILEAILAIIKAFSLDFLNPLKAIVALLLAAIRTIINQLKSTGFAILLVHPDFSQPDFGAVLQSVSGAYPRFESKVVSKFYDTADIFRPQYPNGSAVAMLIFYIGADSPGDLMSQIFALLYFLKHPQILTGLPAPVNVKCKPVNQSGAAISRFQKLFDSSLDKAIQLEWQMPMAPSGGTAPGFINALVSFYDSFRFPNFVVERSELPQGVNGNNSIGVANSSVTMELRTQTVGQTITGLQNRFSFSPVDTTTTVVEANTNNPLKNFEKKIAVNSATGLAEGALTGTYRYLDQDFEDSDRGKTFYYRIRAYFGNPQNYLSATSPGDGTDGGDYGPNVKKDPHNKLVYVFEDGVVISIPSAVARGFVPRALPSNAVFDLYNDIFRAVKAGILLNFEFPPATAQDSAQRREQKTGWGTLSLVGGQIGPLKSAYKSSDKLQQAFLFGTTARRIANQCAVQLYSNPALADLVAQKWSAGAQDAVTTLEQATVTWQFVGIKSGITTAANAKITDYLSKEDSYQDGAPYTGPFPVTPLSQSLSADLRQDLADFLRLALTPLSGQSKYLAWYSVTIGDIFPAFIPFIYDFEQFILALLKAIESALQEIEDIIQTLISKIQQLENILAAILALIDLLKVNVSVSILATSNTNGSASSLAQALLQSDNKPGDSPFGLHSGLVMTVGGPGEGALAALKAIAFLLQIPLG